MVYGNGSAPGSRSEQRFPTIDVGFDNQSDLRLLSGINSIGPPSLPLAFPNDDIIVANP